LDIFLVAEGISPNHVLSSGAVIGKFVPAVPAILGVARETETAAAAHAAGSPCRFCLSRRKHKGECRSRSCQQQLHGMKHRAAARQRLRIVVFVAALFGVFMSMMVDVIVVAHLTRHSPDDPKSVRKNSTVLRPDEGPADRPLLVRFIDRTITANLRV
jgi:hypothetical protein